MATSGELGRRKHQLTRDPSMRQLAHGLWCRADSPPDHVQRAMLLQRHLNGPGSSVRITGITALQVLGIPIGSHYRWADRALCHPAPPRGNDLDEHLHRVLHLSWHGERCKTRDPSILMTKSYGLGSYAGPWGSTLVHPVEALVVAAPMMSRWALTAALDALLVHRDLRPVDSTPAWTSQSCGEPLSLADIYSALETLPPTSRAVMAVRTALKSTQFPTLSPMETLTRLMLLACGLPCPVMNFRVDTRLGYSLLDLAWPEHKTAIEFNGRVHSENHHAYKNEMYRNEVLRDLGWKLRIIVFDDLRDPARSVEWRTWLGRQLWVVPRFPAAGSRARTSVSRKGIHIP